MSFHLNFINESVIQAANTTWACMEPFNSTFCMRHSIVTALSLLTLVIVTYKLFCFHYRHHSLWHHYLIFYASSIELVLLFVHWMLVPHIELAFVALFLKSVQALTVVYFYCSLAAHQLRQERIFSRVFVPALVVIGIYFIGTMIYALVTTTDNSNECYDSSWSQFSVGELVLSIVFLLAGVQITRKINSIRMASTSRRQQKFGLWLLISAFFASSLCGVTVDLYALTNRTTGCEELLGENDGIGDTMRYIFVRVFRYLVSIWSMVFVFRVPEASNVQSSQDSDPEPVGSPYRPVNDYYGSVATIPSAIVPGENRSLLSRDVAVAGSFTQFPPSSHLSSPHSS